MSTLAFFLEEPSAKEMLQGVVPRIIPEGVSVRYVPFEGKQDMNRQLARKLRGWLTPDTRFIVLRDQDSGNCLQIKQELVHLCATAGHGDALVRIACHEIESFYLGDLEAVENALVLHGVASRQRSRKYRDPDQLNNAVQELVRVTSGVYQKIVGSRAIGPCLKVDGSNRSRSFNVLIAGIQKVANELIAA